MAKKDENNLCDITVEFDNNIYDGTIDVYIRRYVIDMDNKLVRLQAKPMTLDNMELLWQTKPEISDVYPPPSMTLRKEDLDIPEFIDILADTFIDFRWLIGKSTKETLVKEFEKGMEFVLNPANSSPSCQECNEGFLIYDQKEKKYICNHCLFEIEI